PQPVSAPVTLSQDQAPTATSPLSLHDALPISHTWTLTTTLAQGTYNQLNATATDEAGNTSNATTAQTVQVDTAAPAISFATVSFTDTGVLGDHITNNGLVTLSGAVSDNVTVSRAQEFTPHPPPRLTTVLHPPPPHTTP